MIDTATEHGWINYGRAFGEAVEVQISCAASDGKWRARGKFHHHRNLPAAQGLSQKALVVAEEWKQVAAVNCEAMTRIKSRVRPALFYVRPVKVRITGADKCCFRIRIDSMTPGVSHLELKPA